MEYHVPSEWFHIRETNNPLDEIRSVTNNLINLPKEYKDLKYLLDGSLRKVSCYYGQMDAPSNLAIIKKVNGKRGFFLKKTIHETVIYFIWWDKVNSAYLFWGSCKMPVIDAMNRIRYRILKYATIEYQMHLDIKKEEDVAEEAVAEEAEHVEAQHIAAIQHIEEAKTVTQAPTVELLKEFTEEDAYKIASHIWSTYKYDSILTISDYVIQYNEEPKEPITKPAFVDTRPECCTRHPQGYCEHARRGPIHDISSSPAEKYYESDDDDVEEYRRKYRISH
jgi:hypothetical protein